MAPPKLTDREAPAVVTNGASTAAVVRSRLPRGLRFPLLLTLNYGITSGLWSFAANFIGDELGAVSKRGNNLETALLMLAIKTLTVWTQWRANYDWLDVSYLTVLSNAPYLYLLTTYFEIPTMTVMTFLHIEYAANVLPTYLLRPASPIHNPKVPLRNRFLLNDSQVQITTALLGVTVYFVTLWASLKTGFLNVWIVKHFDVPTLENAHNEGVISLLIKIFTTGIAARGFLLNPSFGAQTGALTPVEPFDAAAADLPATLKHNFWFWSRRTRTLIKQTAVLSLFTFANTVRRCLTIRDSDAVGAAGYAMVWVVATAITAGWWAWVGAAEEVEEED